MTTINYIYNQLLRTIKSIFLKRILYNDFVKISEINYFEIHNFFNADFIFLIPKKH